MNVKDPQLLEAIRRQFDSAPYPRVPIENSPKDSATKIFSHAIQTPYYLRDQRVIDSRDRVILDAGCGSGIKSLALAIANPGARIVGLDLSPESVNVARHRLEYHGIQNAKFHALSIYDLPQLGLTFDYINCDEVLYCLPDPAAALQVMQSVLKPDGIIRVNLHSYLQRQRFYRGQDIFKELGLFDEGPTAVEAEIVREFMKALNPLVEMKRFGWNSKYEATGDSDNNQDELVEDSNEIILMNYLLAGDTGFAIPQAFSLMRSAGLEFISLLDWKKWELTSLLKKSYTLPPVWNEYLANASEEDRLRLFELLQPTNRLIDFWCGNPRSHVPAPLTHWNDATWEAAQVYLHPYMKIAPTYQLLVESVEYGRPVELSYQPFEPKDWPYPYNLGESLLETKSLIDSTLAACMLALWNGPLSVRQLIDRYMSMRPLDPVTLAPCDRAHVASLIKAFLKKQAEYAVFMIEPASV